MTRKFLIIAGCVVLGAAISSCDGTRREPGRAYAPDMTYSRAYETYTPAQERLKTSGVEGEVHYTGRPVEGTIARGDMMAYTLKNDSAGYVQSAGIKSPIAIASVNMKEAERLYLVNCGICHGAKLDGNGPLWKDGNGPFTSAPRNFMEPAMKAMPEGTMFHSVTYGIRQMGSYASQLNTKQRWEVIAYIKSKQFPGGTAPAADTTAGPAADSAAVATTK
ncbi:c-type cytochrome [Terrimonas alba]|uniref:c-type cytochrome n=1 Tax=Terrimonas alba TaxID=3349636 RepID=UPI0035F39127